MRLIEHYNVGALWTEGGQHYHTSNLYAFIVIVGFSHVSLHSITRTHKKPTQKIKMQIAWRNNKTTTRTTTSDSRAPVHSFVVYLFPTVEAKVCRWHGRLPFPHPSPNRRLAHLHLCSYLRSGLWATGMNSHLLVNSIPALSKCAAHSSQVTADLEPNKSWFDSDNHHVVMRVWHGDGMECVVPEVLCPATHSPQLQRPISGHQGATTPQNSVLSRIRICAGKAHMIFGHAR